MPIPPKIVELVERFQLHCESYLSASYNETQLRHEFVDPFFEELGWDIHNKQGFAEAYKDVIHEAAIKFGSGATKAPDHCMQIGGTWKFFVETKRPSVNLKEDPAPAFQLRRYGWSAKLPLSILTDFEEFAVYDCRIRPYKTDKASVARTLYVTFDEYATRWDEIAAIFSRDAVWKGSFDKYAESSKKKRGTAEVDATFLQDIEAWRVLLARNLALRNPELSQRELNFSVQRIIDRIIFLRICEDRGVEGYGRLQALQNGPSIYPRLCELFRQADERYNSGIFHFQKERGRAEAPDELTLSLGIDDQVLRQIIAHLYYPDCPYEFSVLTADILGQVYEQFLGKIIRLTKGHHAVVEEKPEIKKAGGVYYTPTQIVAYIVKRTIGKLVENRTPKQIEKLRIVDPACGSGSFLIGAYQFLLDWHLQWYSEHEPRKLAPGKRPPIYQSARAVSAGHNWRLTTAEKKRILLNNIYGVDIDQQAVEVTKLSLVLKVLEGESQESLNRQLRFFKERALPDLGNNIKCGNSLVASDFYNGHQMSLFGDEERLRVNAFDWENEFPKIMAAGGFDAVIGNPPYIRIQNLSEFSPEQASYVKKQYASASSGSFDVYVVFVERGLQLLNETGRLGFIVPSKFFSTDYGAPLRNLLTKSRTLEHLVDFGHEQVFSNATTYTCLIFLDRRTASAFEYARTVPAQLAGVWNQIRPVSTATLGASSWLFNDTPSEGLLKKLNQLGRPLLQLPAAMSRGSSTGADDVFCLHAEGRHLKTRDGNAVEIETRLLRRPIYATDFTRFDFRPRNEERIIFPYRVVRDGYQVVDELTMRKEFPKAFEYLRSKRPVLESRKQWSEWYGYSAPRNLHVHDHASILVPLLAVHGIFAPMPERASDYCLMASGGFSVSLADPEIDPDYVLGLLNSRLLFWNLRLISNRFRGGWITCTKQYFGTLPIRTIDLHNSAQTKMRDRLLDCVSTIRASHKSLEIAKTEHEQTTILRQIDALDRQIDRLVYEFFELTAAEIEMVESCSEQRTKVARSVEHTEDGDL